MPSSRRGQQHGPRKNISKACTFCKTRKRKCNGQQPCAFCKLKNREDECSYNFVDKRSVRYANTTTRPGDNREQENLQSPASHNSIPTPPKSSQSDFGLSSPALVHHNTGQQQHQHQQQDHTNLSPRSFTSRLIHDKQNNFRHIGEGSPLALLSKARRLFLSTDLHQIVPLQNRNRITNPYLLNLSSNPSITAPLDITDYREFIPTHRELSSIQLPDIDTATTLIKIFAEGINQAIYFFHDDFLNSDLLNIVYNNKDQIQDPRILCHFYLILSTAFIHRKSTNLGSEGNDHELYLDHALNILQTITEDNNLWLVQVHMLKAVYGLFVDTSYQAWLDLGRAISLAETLGLNRRRANLLFENKQMSFHRRKIWRGLYILDRNISLSLGLPLHINDQYWDDMNSLPIEGNNDNNLRSVCQNELMKLSRLNGDIYGQIYFNRDGITAQSALKLGFTLKCWQESLPHALKPSKLLKLKNATSIADDKSAYHSILFLHLVQFDGVFLLSRPFFHFHLTRYFKAVVSNIKSNSTEITNENLVSSKLTRTFYFANVNAAIFTIRFCWYFIKNRTFPVFSYLMVNNILHSGLVLCLVKLLHIVRVYEAIIKKDQAALRKTIAEYNSNYKVFHVSLIILREYTEVDHFSVKFHGILKGWDQALETTADELFKTVVFENTLLNQYTITTNVSDEEADLIDEMNDELQNMGPDSFAYLKEESPNANSSNTIFGTPDPMTENFLHGPFHQPDYSILESTKSPDLYNNGNSSHKIAIGPKFFVNGFPDDEERKKTLEDIHLLNEFIYDFNEIDNGTLV